MGGDFLEISKLILSHYLPGFSSDLETSQSEWILSVNLIRSRLLVDSVLYTRLKWMVLISFQLRMIGFVAQAAACQARDGERK